MNVHNHTDHPRLTPVSLTGTAKEGRAGPPIGLVDVGVSERAYLFRVSLPGIEKEKNRLRCEIEREGKVCVKGVVPDVELVKGTSSLCQMHIQHMCPPGPFSITFHLPGPVDPRLFSPTLRPDGVLEVVVMKFQASSTGASDFDNR